MPLSLLTRNMNLAPAVVTLYGSLRKGRADLVGGYQVAWTTTPAFFALPHLATSFTLDGSDSRVTGEVQYGFSGITLQGVQGRAGPGLARLVPGAWRCDMTANLRDVGFFWGWRRAAASGVITTAEGTCAMKQRKISLPPLALRLRGDGTDAIATLTGRQASELAEIKLRRARTLDIEIQPTAADIFPQFPRGGPINLSLTF
ncbi:hypothetical protein OS190_13180 [Sulfitobacter sp. F26204]|uniref:hypothetical protein n=1 Tax=Sulfitobacter sp. F26204 TaxID=2996014 RepID=UPI00225DD836|nr:hypothetical protein [Sulfitobacter sp. F26204]MCX7560523.1 hypothetical protein [Sulfitobacter sp. F26204]